MARSVRTAEPPAPSQSTTVTSAPSRAATSAASSPGRPNDDASSPFSVPHRLGAYSDDHGGTPRASNPIQRDGALAPHSPQRSTGWLPGWQLTFGGETAVGRARWRRSSRIQTSRVRLFTTSPTAITTCRPVGAPMSLYKIRVRVHTLDGDACLGLRTDGYEGGLPSAPYRVDR
jgi:hypothetical protein